MHLRPQAHDIIRTWLFSTVLRSHLEENALPWTNAAISGWVLDPDRKKMSKSKGNVVTPMGLLEEHGSDAVRYWAAKGGPGVDTAFEVGQMKVGRRLAIKLLNASKFVLMKPAKPGPITELLDRSMLRKLEQLVDRSVRDLADYEYGAALRDIETFFWSFCDDYIELIKRARDGNDAAASSADTAARVALNVLLRLFAPYLPFATEEVWSWTNPDSVHHAPWPKQADVNEVAVLLGAWPSAPDDAREGQLYNEASLITAAVRAQRTALNLNRSVQIHARFRLALHESNWVHIKTYVCDDNNIVGEPVVEFGSSVPDGIDVTIEPVAPDA